MTLPSHIAMKGEAIMAGHILAEIESCYKQYFLESVGVTTLIGWWN